jgi:beta-lactam-binding protein with PASTA domain
VIGLRLAPAKSKIRRAHCSVGRVSRAHSRRVGRVLKQSPRAGAIKPRGTKVSLTVGRR